MNGLVGVDAGTNTTSVAILTKDGVKVFVGQNNSPLIPSVVGYETDGKPVFEKRAEELEIVDHRRVVRGAKREIGSQRAIDVLSKKVDPQDVQADLVEYVLTQLFSQVGYEDWNLDNTRVYLSYPVDFSLQMKDIYREAMVKNGIHLDVDDMYDEPLAAITTVAFESGEDIVGKTVMVIDVGGGTTDVCIATVLKDDRTGLRLAVRATDGNKKLGGADYDSVVLDNVIGQISKALGIPSSRVDTNRKNRRTIAVNSEKYKIKLGTQDVVDDLFLQGAPPVHIEISKDWFEENTRFLSEAVVKVVDNALGMAINDHPENLEKLGIKQICSDEDIDRIVFIGGGSKVRSIREELVKAHPVFGDRIDTSIEPQTAVCKGLCYLATIASESETVSNGGTSITKGPTYPVNNRCRDSYGVAVRHPSEGNKVYCHVHLNRGDVIPHHVKKTYVLPEDYEGYVDTIVFTVVDADRNEPVLDPDFGCHVLSKVRIPLKDAHPDDPVDVDLEILSSGLLRVTATVNGVSAASEPIKYETDA